MQLRYAHDSTSLREAPFVGSSLTDCTPHLGRRRPDFFDAGPTSGGGYLFIKPAGPSVVRDRRSYAGGNDVITTEWSPGLYVPGGSLGRVSPDVDASWVFDALRSTDDD